MECKIDFTTVTERRLQPNGTPWINASLCDIRLLYWHGTPIKNEAKRQRFGSTLLDWNLPQICFETLPVKVTNLTKPLTIKQSNTTRPPAPPPICGRPDSTPI